MEVHCRPPYGPPAMRGDGRNTLRPYGWASTGSVLPFSGGPRAGRVIEADGGSDRQGASDG